jgi:hypothetical protein
VGEHGECDVSVPGRPGADLVVVEGCLVFAGPEAFFDWPSCAGYVDEFAESGPVRIVAAVVGVFVVGDGPSDQILAARSVDSWRQS